MRYTLLAVALVGLASAGGFYSGRWARWNATGAAGAGSGEESASADRPSLPRPPSLPATLMEQDELMNALSSDAAADTLAIVLATDPVEVGRVFERLNARPDESLKAIGTALTKLTPDRLPVRRQFLLQIADRLSVDDRRKSDFLMAEARRPLPAAVELDPDAALAYATPALAFERACVLVSRDPARCEPLLKSAMKAHAKQSQILRHLVSAYKRVDAARAREIEAQVEAQLEAAANPSPPASPGVSGREPH